MPKIGDVLYRNCAGVIANWVVDKGYGGVIPYEDHVGTLHEQLPKFKCTFFAHCNDFSKNGEKNLVRNGTSVMFDIREGIKGPYAFHIRIIGQPTEEMKYERNI